MRADTTKCAPMFLVLWGGKSSAEKDCQAERFGESGEGSKLLLRKTGKWLTQDT